MPKAKIPGGITPEHFLRIRSILTSFLEEMTAAAPRSKPSWASCRLNESGDNQDDISPVFVGWVEHPDLAAERVRKNEPDPGLFRFGDDHYSELFEDCIKNPGTVRKRNWHRDLKDPVRGKWMATAKKQSIEAGIMFRRSIGLIADGRAVGTLNVGFARDPAPEDRKIAATLKRWAREDHEPLLTLREHFILTGPKLSGRASR
ncbi:MAG TPA: hypothetical protein VNL14_21665 [Candidatus Acidoferrales bacterium]|nr:hypothetical protein [Candidatus Acidoferrales bacterium]